MNLVFSSWCSLRLSASLFGDRFVKVQQHARYGSPGRDIIHRHPLRQWVRLVWIIRRQVPRIQLAGDEARFLLAEETEQLGALFDGRRSRKHAAEGVRKPLLIRLPALPDR